ncbi:DNA/RNA nuclease SfsA [Brevundimonas sp.]|uniref:DNA/RNA nuclease SfsA n=1 Tax=Brevundimonas sp. TaxID=1871086 RepID=UPI002D52973D|nr:DNA/RNA nuclease SfsA [Brevundimonas sp.]HYC96537.1 DNA/RNA nuclease SfsA [Brevundimonas sp.]
MRFKSSLEHGTLIRRYKRFLADVVLEDGRETTVHVPNPGAMLGLTAPGLPVWLSRSPDPKRKLPLTLEAVILPDAGPVGVNTLNPNRIAEAAIPRGRIPELTGYRILRREVRYDVDSRIDILLEDDAKGLGRPSCWVEIKNCHFSRTPPLAEFPDCNTVRGVKHLKALERVVEAGGRAVMLFIVQRMDCDSFTTADDIDRAYGPALREAASRGVEVLCYSCHLSSEAIRLDRALPWRPHP